MRILVVDDSKSVSIALQSSLEKHGYEVITARDGKEAIALVREHRPDLITMDVQMPEMNGFEASAIIRETEEGRRIPIVFVTSNDTLADREKGFKLGATEFISKNLPSAWNEVVHAVDRCLRTTTLLEGFTILVVEDDEIAKMIVVSCLRFQGCHVLEASTAREALDIANQLQGDLDMVVTDYLMPGMNGDELCLNLRQKLGLRHVPIMIVSEVDQREIMLDLFRAGATDYIIKPFMKEEFLARISGHLGVRELIREMNGNIVELERLNKLRDEFVAVSSHDLKTPLNGIMGFTKLLLMENSLTVKHREWLKMIDQSAEFMLEIVNDIVELSRNETKSDDVEFKPLSLASIVRVAVSSMQQAAVTKGVNLEMVNNFEGDPVIEGDRNKLLRILNNLLSNAVKFTPSGGKVTVSLARDGGNVLLSVIDTGVGIPKDMLPNLFEKFTKASKSGTAGELGTGLGMSITKQLVDKHGGKITVDSTVGNGTTVQLFFPLGRNT